MEVRTESYLRAAVTLAGIAARLSEIDRQRFERWIGSLMIGALEAALPGGLHARG